MKQPTVLVVDDDRLAVDFVRRYLERAGMAVRSAGDGRAALAAAGAPDPPDLIVLDLMLPEVDGIEVCRLLRERSRVPVVMLTARTTAADKLAGLSLGADDYVTKPFSPHELVARVRAVLRRAQWEGQPPEVLRFGDLELDLVGREVRRGGRALTVTARQFDLLAALAAEPGRAFSRLELMDRAFGWDYDGLERTIDAHVKNLRARLEPDPQHPRYILTVPGYGYRLPRDPAPAPDGSHPGTRAPGPEGA
jgi:DNA-binding response OmpR family regulator